MSEFARVRSASSTRLGRPAYTAGLKKPVAKPATPASATIVPAEFANGSAQKTRKRTRSEATISPRRENRSSSGPRKSPTTTAGRNSTIMSALTHGPESVRSLTSTTSATVASRVPRLEPSVARKSSRKPGAVPRRLSCRRRPVTRARSLSGSSCGRPHLRQRSGQERVLSGGSDGHAYRLRRAEAGERPNDDPFAKQALEPRLRILAELDEEEVADGRTSDLVARLTDDVLEFVPSFEIARTAPFELSDVFEARERGLLRGRGQV